MTVALRRLWPFLVGVSALVSNTRVQADEWADMAAEPAWRRLVHYEEARQSPTGWKSAIQPGSFFLSGAEGALDPVAELRATVLAMAQPGVADADAHAQCRFPARRRWLVRVGWPASQHWPEVVCPAFERWSRQQGAESVSVVLATGYLGNPASFYGHTLLKFNLPARGGHTPLQDITVNYGATDTGQDDPLSYMVKGVVGGYQGRFTQIQYHFHDQQYGEYELRDLWEYRLNLSPDAVRQVVAHSWEVLGQPYDYFFFRKNCAYRMAELLEVVDGVSPIPPDRPWTIPQSLIQRLAQAQNPQGQPLLADVVHHPSRQTRFQRSHRLLTPDEAVLFHEWARQGLDPLPEGWRQRTSESQAAVLDTLMDYWQFVTSPAERSAGRLPMAYRQALALRYQVDADAREGAEVPPRSPHLGRPPSWTQVGVVQGPSGRQALRLRIRPAYHDPLDADSGHVAHGALSMGEVQLEVRDSTVRLQQLDLIQVDSASPGQTGLPGDRGFAWKLKAGAEPVRPTCLDCLVGRVQGDVGVGRSLGKKWHVAVYAGGAVQTQHAHQGLAWVRWSAQLIGALREGVSLRLGVERRLAASGRESGGLLGWFEVRQALGHEVDLRLRHDQDGHGRTSLALGWYW